MRVVGEDRVTNLTPMSSNFKAARSVTGEVDGAGVRVALVCGRFNDLVTQRLLEGALGGLGLHGVREQDVTVAWVPGAFEIPRAVRLLDGGDVVVLGVQGCHAVRFSGSLK